VQSLETKSSRPRPKSFETETRPETFVTETLKYVCLETETKSRNSISESYTIPTLTSYTERSAQYEEEVHNTQPNHLQVTKQRCRAI